MAFFKTVFSNKRLIWQMARNDFRNKFSATSLGSVWGFINPLFFMGIYFVIFYFVLGSGDMITPSGKNISFIVWFLSGFAMWLFISDSLASVSQSVRGYSYLVKKTVFNIDIIPVFSLVSNGIVAVFVFSLSMLICLFYTIPNFLIILYMVFCAFVFMMSLTRLTAALTTLIPDMTSIISIFTQMIFWFTAILWDIKIIDAKVEILGKILRCSPFTYLVYGYRQAFTEDLTPIITENHGLYTIVFWSVTILIFLYGNYVFNKHKSDFADIL